ncbi:MAG: hypothetical protein AB7L90_13375 [Hyphomicrobiaceae bacterium]
MYRIEYIGANRNVRIVSPDGLTAADFYQLARDLGIEPRQARKVTRVAARRAVQAALVETRWNGKETESEAQPGDWIVTSLGADGAPLRDDAGHLNAYVIKADRFADLYQEAPNATDTGHGEVFQSRGCVSALCVPGGFEIKAPWGEVQRAHSGWLLLRGREVYGNHTDTFAQTYDLLD